MNTLAKLIGVTNSVVAVGSLALSAVTAYADTSPAVATALPEISQLTTEAGAHIANELNHQLAQFASAAKPVRTARQPSVVISEGDAIFTGEEIVVVAKRLPPSDQKLDTLAAVRNSPDFVQVQF